MTSSDFEKLAGQLAEIATSPNFEKTAFNNLTEFLSSDAGRYLVGGLGGAGAGALLGAAQPDKEKRRKNMLYYGTLGGLGGIGLTHLINTTNASGAPATTTPPDPNKSVKPTAPVFDIPAAASAATTPVNPAAGPPVRFNRVELDAPMSAGRLAQKLPGMEGISPLAQSTGGSAGLAAGVVATRPVRGIINRAVSGFNARALEAANELNNKYLQSINIHNTRDLAAARALADEQAATLRALGARKPQLNAAYRATINPVKARIANELARVVADNSNRTNDAILRNASRSRWGRPLATLARILGISGSTYAGMTAPNWAPDAYNAVNDAYLNNATGK